MKLFFLQIIIIQLLFIQFSSAALQSYSTDGSIHIISNNKTCELSEKWYFKADDSLEYKDKIIELNEWSLIYSHILWTDIPEFKDYRGIAWYRINIVSDYRIIGFALLVSNHYRGAQFYLNGALIYETRHFNKNGDTPCIIGKPDLIVIPDCLIETGTNVLAIRTGWLDNNGGFHNAIQLGPYKRIHKKFILYILWYSFLAAINLFLTLYFLILFWNRRKEVYYLYFSGLSFSLGIWILGYSGLVLWALDYQWAYILFTYIGAILTPFMIICFLHSFLDIAKLWITRLLEFLLLALVSFLIIEFISSGSIYYFQRYLYQPFMLITACTGIYGLILCILGVRNKKPFARRILTGTVILGLSFFISIFDFLSILPVQHIVVEGFFVMTIIYASVLATRFANVHTELEKTYADLVKVDKIKNSVMDKLNIYENIVSSSGDQMAFINRDYTLLAVNNAFLKAYQKKHDDIISLSLEKIFGKKEFEDTVKDYCDQCLSGDEIHFEKWYKYRGIGDRYMIVSMYPYVNVKGKITGIVMNLSDITERVQLEKSMIEIGESERRDIGIELHDGLSQKLLSVAMKASMLSSDLTDTEPDKSLIASEIESLLNSTIDDTRSLARGCFPLDLEGAGIAGFIDEIRLRFEKKHNISFVIDIDKSIDIEDKMISTQLSYIIQEAVNNSVKHSGTEIISIILKNDNKSIVLSVRDYGIGIPDKIEGNKGIGLNIMKYRARMFGASLNIGRVSGGGTEVVCRFKI